MFYARSLAAIFALAAAMPALADYNLQFDTAIPIAGSLNAVTIADFDGDGRSDVVAAGFFEVDDQYAPMLMVTLQQNDGTLAAPVFHATDGAGRGLSIGQLDRDAHPEVVSEVLSETQFGIGIVDHDTVRRVSVVHRRAYENEWFRNAYRIELIDVDRDGAIDVVTKPIGHDVVIYLGNGAGGIRRLVRMSLPINNYVDASAGDFNGDGFRDFVVISSVMRAYVYLNNGTEGFSAPYVLNPNPTGASPYPAIVGGDFNGDGRDDLAMTTDFGQLSLYFHGENGQLSFHRQLATDPLVTRLRAHDIDLDDKLDLLAGHGGGIGLFVQRDGDLDPERLLNASTDLFAGMGLGDLDGDGCPDLASYGAGNNELWIFRGVGCPATADLTLDVALATTQATLVLGNQGATAASAPELEAELSASTGGITLGELPEGCEAISMTTLSVGLVCSLADLGAGAEHTLTVPFAWSGTDRRNVISVSATATTVTPETRLRDNSDRASLRVPAGQSLTVSQEGRTLGEESPRPTFVERIQGQP